jgi:pyruvate dehydrogenase E2 component (dihydrolipoamide acetyltransferase)
MGVIRLPRLGETMEEARVVLWLKGPGDAFARGDVLLEVETDKTVVEVPALEAGTLARQLVAPGETVALGQPIAETDGAEASKDGPVDAAPEPPAPEPVPEWVGARTRASGSEDVVAASPRARRLSREAGLDLGTLRGTGRNGWVSGADVLAALRPAGGSAPSAVHVRRRAPTGAATGAPLVLLHGLFDSARGWRDLPERLAQAGHAVLVPDLPGHGRSARGDGTLAGAEAALAAILPAAGPVGLVGHSLGAVLATGLARALGPRLDRLVLIAPAGLGPRMDADFLDLMAGARTTAALARALARLGPGSGPYSEEALSAELDRLAPRRDAMVALGRGLAQKGIQQVDTGPLLEGVAAPVTAVFGLDDPIIDWRDAAHLPARAAIHFIKGAGHLPHAVQPDLVADLILARGAACGGPA